METEMCVAGCLHVKLWCGKTRSMCLKEDPQPPRVWSEALLHPTCRGSMRNASAGPVGMAHPHRSFSVGAVERGVAGSPASPGWDRASVSLLAG